MIAARSAVIIGASGGIGGALAKALDTGDPCQKVHGFARSFAGAQAIDVTDEKSVAAAAAQVAASDSPPDLVIIASGLLHEQGRGPEKKMADIDGAWMARNFAVNAIGPALVAKYFLPLQPRRGRTVFAVLSARVGSIGDNRSGGWYSYRASKAALHQIVRSLSIAEARRNPASIVVSLHPGTVDTPLSAPFQRGLADGQLTRTTDAATNLLGVIAGLTASDSGRIFDWQGREIVP